jgi:polysaccharide export outer membrane protein
MRDCISDVTTPRSLQWRPGEGWPLDPLNCQSQIPVIERAIESAALHGCASAIRGLQLGAVMRRFSNSQIPFFNFLVILGFLGSFQLVSAQNGAESKGATRQSHAAMEPSRMVTGQPDKAQDQDAAPTPQQNSSALVIGPGDELEIAVYGAPDLSEHTRVSEAGNISMPLIGVVRVAGLSSSEAAGAVQSELRRNNIVNDPQVSVYVKEYTSSGISVAGEVAKPGFYSALGPHRLFDVLQSAGGPTDKADNKVVIRHRDQKDSVTLRISKDPAEMAASNVALQPGDTVVVPRAGIVYVLGEVNRPGGFVLNSTGGLTVLQIVAVAGGPSHVASAGKTRLLRRTGNGFQEERIDLTKLLRGKAHDVAVRDQDILFVPSSVIKTALNASALIGIAASAAIYRVP